MDSPPDNPSLPSRIIAAPILLNPEAVNRTRRRIAPGALRAWDSAGAGDFLDAVLAGAPYLARLAARQGETLGELARRSPEAVCAEACAAARAWRADEDEPTAMARLRAAKARMHLAAALADLAGAWEVTAMTRAVSDFADAACQGAFAAAARLNRFEAADPDNPVPGAFLLALGKQGAQTLNYSSDIDLVALWEPDIARQGAAPGLRQAYPDLGAPAQRDDRGRLCLQSGSAPAP